MLYNDTTWNRLNRFFNIFNPKVYRSLILTNGFLLVWAVISIANKKISFGEYIFIAFLMNLFTAPSIILHCPKKLFLYGKTAEFKDYISMKPKYIHSTNFWWLKVSYTVSEIKDLQFHQNAFEKFFDVGHISFSGNAAFAAKRDVDRIEPKDTYAIYGIRNFSAFQATHRK